jgi:hypothetical protein
MKDDEEVRAGLLASAREVIEGHGEAALAGGLSLEEAARAWIDAGFEDTEEIDEWLSARCFHAEWAKRLEMAGVTPEQAALRTSAGRAPYEETIGYKVAAGDLGLDEARRIITTAFWDS